MRVGITFRLNHPTPFPIDHQHALAGTLAGLIERVSPDSPSLYGFRRDRFPEETDHASHLNGDERSFYPYCCSSLRSRRRRIVGETLYLGPGPVKWWIGSPIKPVLSRICAALLAEKRLEVLGKTFAVRNAVLESIPNFGERAAFTCLSPITFSTSVPANGSRRIHYLRPEEDASEIARLDLMAKFEAMNGSRLKNARLRWFWDPDYLSQRVRATKLVTIHQGTPEEMRVVGILAPFVVEGSPELIELGYTVGFGEKNDLGFGMVAVSG